MKFARHASLTILATVATMGVIACGGSNNEEAKSPETTASSTSTTSSSTTSTDIPEPASTTTNMGPSTTGAAAGGSGSSAPSSTGSMAGAPGSSGMGSDQASTAPLTDEQIGAITMAANNGEIEQAKLAQQKTKDARVKKFAAMMVSHHTEANTKQTALFTKLKMSPSENSWSTQLTTDTGKTTDSLKGQTGADFDKAYIDAQVKEHQMVLDTLDNKLIPAAKNADLKTQLQGVRAKVEMHLKEAQKLQGELNKTASK